MEVGSLLFSLVSLGSSTNDVSIWGRGGRGTGDGAGGVGVGWQEVMKNFVWREDEVGWWTWVGGRGL